jgi:hypothetical protein
MTTTYGGRRRWGGALVILALVAVLAVIAALALPTLLGGEGERGGVAQNNAGQAPGGGDQAQGDQAQGEQAQPPSADEPAPGEPQDGLTADAAVRTVEDFYTLTSAGNYDRSAQLLSEGWRQSTFPDRATFEGTFAEVESVEFIEGPAAQLSGDTATVTGRTRATKTDQIELNEGTWYLVDEGGEWKIDGWDVTNISTRSA